MDAVGTVDSDWVRAHQELSALAKQRAKLDFREGTALLQALRTDVHRWLGHGSFAEYVGRLFGYSRRTIEDKLRTAEALENLPETNRALAHGELNGSVARELARVATPQTERAWLAAAQGKTVRQLEQMVSGRRPGDLPTDPSRPEAVRHTLRFDDLSPETFATFREAIAHLRRKSDAPLDDNAVLMQMAREILQGPGDDGRASYQLAVTTCDRCQQSFQQGAGELVPLEPEVLEKARCDSQHTHVGGRATQEVPPKVRREVMRRDHGRCVVPGCRHATFVDVHHVVPREENGAHSADNLVVLCCAHHDAVHRGQLIIEGRVSTGLVFLHADGTTYGELPSAPASDARERAFLALRGLHFKEGDIRRALARLDLPHAGVEQLVRAALRLLTG